MRIGLGCGISDLAIRRALTYIPPAPDITPPTITSANPSGSYAEMVPIGGTLTANEGVTWSKSGTDASRVTLNAATGAWTLEATDYELGLRSYAWTFTATDGAGNARDQIVAIAITDIDDTAPTLSSPTDAASGSTGATLSVATNEVNGTLYWFVGTSATPPSAAALKAGTGAVAFGSQAVTSAGVQNATASGLSASITYYAHFLHRDTAGNESAIATADGFTTGAGGVPSNEVAFTPDMMFRNSDGSAAVTGGGFYAIDDASSIRDASDVQAVPNGTSKVNTIRDRSGQGNHLTATGNSGAAAADANRGTYGNNMRGGYPAVSLNIGGGNQKYVSAINGAANRTIILTHYVRTPATALSRVALGDSSGNFVYRLVTSDTTVRGRTSVGTNTGATGNLEVVTDDGIRTHIQRKNPSNNTAIGRIGGQEVDAGSGPGAPTNAGRPVLGNNWGSSSSGEDMDFIAMLDYPGTLSRWHEQLYEGWLRKTFGIALASGHPYETIDPTVPAGTLGIADVVGLNLAPSTRRQTYFGAMVQIENDSYYTQNPESSTDQHGLLRDLLPADKRSLSPLTEGDIAGSQFLALRERFKGYALVRFSLGNQSYRGYTVTDPGSGLGKSFGQRWAGQDAQLKRFIAGMGNGAGGKLLVGVWSPEPHWKTTSSIAKGTLWAGGSYARTVTLDSIRSTDPTQYQAQLSAYAANCVAVLERLHVEIAPVVGFLINEAGNSTEDWFGTCVWTDALQLDFWTTFKPLFDTSSVFTAPQKAGMTFVIDTWDGPDATFRASALWADSRFQAGFHHCSAMGSDADYIKATSNYNSLIATNLKSGKEDGVNQDEHWIPNETPVTTLADKAYVFANNVLKRLNMKTLGKARFNSDIIHLGKPKHSSVYTRYAPVVYTPATYGTDPVAGEPARGTYLEQPWHANSVLANIAHQQTVQAEVVPVYYPGQLYTANGVFSTTPAGVQVCASIKGGKIVWELVNRTASPLTMRVACGGARVIKGYGYEGAVEGSDLRTVNASIVTVNLSANGAATLVEQ